jgi:mono/diheme cytochrome c family protein
MMRWRTFALAVVCLLVVAVAVGLPMVVGLRPFIGPKARRLTDRRFQSSPERIERGRYLVTSGRAPCVICHSPLETAGGELKVKEGMAFAGRTWEPDGVPFVTASNLTPDPETGVGRWTDDELARAIREGIGRDGRALFPTMPYEKFRSMSDEDVASVIVYLRSLKPIKNALAKSHVPFPLNRLINNVPRPIDGPLVPDLSTPEKRGEYIVTGAACADCHTPMDAHGTPVTGMDFAGGNTMLYGDWKSAAATNITPAVNGIPYYTEALFIEAFRTGRVRSRPLNDMMPTRYYRAMTDADLKDVFAYLKTLTPVDHYVDNSLPSSPCARCGLSHGGGERNAALP